MNIIGLKFGRLTIIELTKLRTKDRKTIVNCKCDCGTIKLETLTLLKQGKVISCGCARSEQSAHNARKGVQKLIDSGKYTADPAIGTAKRIFSFYKDGDISFEQFYALSQMNCYYCGAAPNNRSNGYTSLKYSESRRKNGTFVYNGLDRTDNDLGHTIDNVVPCCVFCNKAKLNRSKDDFLSWVKTVCDRHCK